MSKENLHFDNQRVNKLFSGVLISKRNRKKKEIENMYSVFLSNKRNTRESLGELEKIMDAARVPTAH